jgi:ssDNA-binding Zn-finger/Zn-ribbon topoisomerase 1
MNGVLVTSVLVIVVFVVIIAVGVLLSRGKQLKCPDCEHVFNAPIMEEKTMGFGLTFPYLGTVRCPKCGNKRSRRDYIKVEQQTKKHRKLVR